jgi:hypothetical protein
MPSKISKGKCISVLGAVPAVHAEDPTISITASNGSTVCPASPLSGTWSGDTCTISGPVTIMSGTILDIGVGVSVTVSGGAADSFHNYGIIDNYGTMTGTSGSSNWAIENDNIINNYGTMTGSGFIGVQNSGTINNAGTMTGSSSSSGGYGIDNAGTINNDGAMTGVSSLFDGIYNGNNIYDYCGVTLTDSSYSGNMPNAVACYTVTFDQSGIPSGVTWGITASWGPFVLPEDHTGTGASITVLATGSMTYSFDTVTNSGTTYSCTSASISGGLGSYSLSPTFCAPMNGILVGASGTVSADYSATSSTGVPQFPLGLSVLFALVAPALLVLRKKTLSFKKAVDLV